MKPSDPNDFGFFEESELIKGSKLFMHKAFKTIICPTGELVFILHKKDLKTAFEDLRLWKLGISSRLLNQ